MKIKLIFYNSFSSTMKILNHINLCNKLLFINDEIYNDLRKRIYKISNMLKALRKSQLKKVELFKRLYNFTNLHPLIHQFTNLPIHQFTNPQLNNVQNRRTHIFLSTSNYSSNSCHISVGFMVEKKNTTQIF